MAGTHRAHIEILFDLSFDELKNDYGFTNFVELHNAWQKTLDTSELNKKFYRELANWYFWAIKNVEFPADEEKDKDIRNAINVIRLITRFIFVWFLKEKGLVRDELFNQQKLAQLLSFKDKNKSTYYKAILQNLFFATLNTEMNKDKPGSRKFRHKAREQGQRDQHYMIHNIFRYEDYFINPLDTLKKYFDNIPFLNGGLFECLDKKATINSIDKVIRVDGFSDHPENILKVPGELFFSPEQPIDLNEIYDTKNKTYKVRGLIDILNSYKFTVHENTPIEEEVALDPELLGKVFENLLASYNPETRTTARKLTGSFYSPREIVNHMVDESLIAYLQTQLIQKLPKLDKEEEERIAFKLRHLFSYTDEAHQFTREEVNILIEAIDNIKILDPTCGSGAFPMGILHKLVYILSKLDPENKEWKQRQINKVSEISDSAMREKFLEDIEQSFQNNELDYGRKLYLIENCIFGVDIQPVAVQIAKLRFFISLIVDQRIDVQKENLGIRPLPNLETRFIAANSLIGIGKGLHDKTEQLGQRGFQSPEIERKEKELKKVRERYFTARTLQTKEKYRKEDERLRAEISKLLENEGWPAEVTKRLVDWNPYDQNTSANFFDPEWMFGVTDGFGVVIGNPPYGLLNKRQNKAESILVTPRQLEYYKNSPDYKEAGGGMINIFRLFILRSIQLLCESGVFSEIFPLAFVADSSVAQLRRYILNNCTILFIEAFPERDNPKKRVFEASKMSVCIMNLTKCKNTAHSFFIRIQNDRYIDESKQKTLINKDIISLLDRNNFTIPLVYQSDLKLLVKIYRKSVNFGNIGHCYTGEIDLTLGKQYLSKDSKDATLLRGAIIDRYMIRETMGQGEILYLKKQKYLSENTGQKSTHVKCQRIVMQGITGVNEKVRLKMTIVNKDIFCANSVNYFIFTDKNENPKFTLGIFNSRLLNYIFIKFSTNSNVNGYEIDNLPYPNFAAFLQQVPIIECVDQILTARQKDPRADTLALEKHIDVMVYKLYGLTHEEVKIVDPEFAMSEVEYEAFKMK